MEAEWAVPGTDVICIRELPWYGKALIFLIEIDGPQFMKQYKIKDVSYRDDEDTGHHVKLHFDEYEGRFCSCGFRPLEKIEDEEEKQVTAPVTPEVESVS